MTRFNSYISLGPLPMNYPFKSLFSSIWKLLAYHNFSGYFYFLGLTMIFFLCVQVLLALGRVRVVLQQWVMHSLNKYLAGSWIILASLFVCVRFLLACFHSLFLVSCSLLNCSAIRPSRGWGPEVGTGVNQWFVHFPLYVIGSNSLLTFTPIMTSTI